MIIRYCHFLFLLYCKNKEALSSPNSETKGLKFRGTTLIHRCLSVHSFFCNGKSRPNLLKAKYCSIWELRGELGSLRICLAPDGSSLYTQFFLILLFYVCLYETIHILLSGFFFVNPCLRFFIT